MRRELEGLGLNSCIAVRKPSDEPIMPSACGDRVMIWGWFSWSGLGSAMLCAQRMRSADDLNIVNDQVFTISGFCEIVVQGQMRHHFHTWIGHHRVQTLTSLRIFEMSRENFTQRPNSPIINTRSWQKMNTTQEGNKMFWHYVNYFIYKMLEWVALTCYLAGQCSKLLKQCLSVLTMLKQKRLVVMVQRLTIKHSPFSVWERTVWVGYFMQYAQQRLVNLPPSYLQYFHNLQSCCGMCSVM